MTKESTLLALRRSLEREEERERIKRAKLKAWKRRKPKEVKGK